MKLFALLLAAAALFAADEKKPAPKPVPTARYEEISQKMIAMQRAQVAYLGTKVQSDEERKKFEKQIEDERKKFERQVDTVIGKAEDALRAAQQEYATLEDALRKDSGAGAECSLDEKKQWKCPPSK